MFNLFHFFPLCLRLSFLYVFLSATLALASVVFHLGSLELTQKQFKSFAMCLSSVCCSVTSEQDAVTKLHRCVVKIKTKAELEGR